MIELACPSRGAQALIWPGGGCNCVQLRLATDGGAVTQLIAPPVSPDLLRRQPARWGIPILFPWPGRIPGGLCRWRGRDWRLPENGESGNAIHGLVIDRPWQVTGMNARESEAVLHCSIADSDLGENGHGFPFNWRLDVNFTLRSDELVLRFQVTNCGTDRLPFGLGAHPWFEVPFGPEGSAADCLLSVPAGEIWNVDVLREISPEKRHLARRPVRAEESFAESVPIRSRTMNGVLTGLTLRDGRSESVLEDPAAGCTLTVRASEDFKSIVLFGPEERDALCVEPWTCPPNVFNVAEAGVNNTGLLELEPGGDWSGEIAIRLTQSRQAGGQGINRS